MQAQGLRVWRTVGLTLSVWLVCGQTRAEETAVRVRVARDACPSAALVEQKLQPLLSDDMGEVEITDAPLDTDRKPKAEVYDFGSRYRVEIDGLSRELEDRPRDCVERARVAAVFIALNLHQSPTRARLAAREKPSDLQLGLQLSAAAAYATQSDRGSAGGGLGVWLKQAGWRIAWEAGVLTPVELALEPRGTLHSSIALMRFPSRLAASYLFSTGRYSFGPTVGLDLDLLRIRGQSVVQPRTSLRINPGLLLAAEAHLQLGAAWSLGLRLGLDTYARAYDLAVSPTGSLGKTPRLWLAASLGVAWRFR